MKTAKYVYSTQPHEKATKMGLNIPHTMELVETVEIFQLLMHGNRFPYPCRDRATELGLCFIFLGRGDMV